MAPERSKGVVLLAIVLTGGVAVLIALNPLLTSAAPGRVGELARAVLTLVAIAFGVVLLLRRRR